MTTHAVSYDLAINEAVQQISEQYPVLENEVRALFKRAIRSYIDGIAHAVLDSFIDEQTLSDVHKKEYQDSFRVTVFDDAVRLDFNPSTPLIGAIEDGGEERSMNEALLSKNYKISKEGHRYKIVPLKSKDPLPGAVNFRMRDIKAGQFNEEQFFQSFVALIKNKEVTVPFEITQRGDVFDYRSVPMRVQVVQQEGDSVGEIKWKNQRVYLSKSRANIVNSVDRFTVFRTISSKPGTHQWRSHKGFPGLRLASYLSTRYHELITNYAKALVKGTLA